MERLMAQLKQFEELLQLVDDLNDARLRFTADMAELSNSCPHAVVELRKKGSRRW
jgi:hypothetical protein